MQWRADRMAVRPFIDSRRDGDASGMPDPEMCVSGRDFSCLSGMLDDEEVRRENGFVKWHIENGFVKLCFTHRLAPQAILIICKCKTLQAVFALQLKNRFLRLNEKKPFFSMKRMAFSIRWKLDCTCDFVGTHASCANINRFDVAVSFNDFYFLHWVSIFYSHVWIPGNVRY